MRRAPIDPNPPYGERGAFRKLTVTVPPDEAQEAGISLFEIRFPSQNRTNELDNRQNERTLQVLEINKLRRIRKSPDSDSDPRRRLCDYLVLPCKGYSAAEILVITSATSTASHSKTATTSVSFSPNGPSA